jgi:hypothetical protein
MRRTYVNSKSVFEARRRNPCSQITLTVWMISEVAMMMTMMKFLLIQVEDDLLELKQVWLIKYC